MTDAPNPQLVPGWNVQVNGNEALISSAGESSGLVASVNGATGAVVVIDAAVAKVAHQAAETQATAPASAADTATLAKLADVQALITAYNTMLTAFQTAKHMA